jgi:hypothetical protein
MPAPIIPNPEIVHWKSWPFFDFADIATLSPSASSHLKSSSETGK